MRKLFLALILAASLALPACSGDKDKIRFIDTYKEILVAREKYADTSIANKIVHEVLKKHGFTDSDFKKTFFKLAENKTEFFILIDSARNEAKKEFLRSQKPQNGGGTDIRE